MSCSPFDLRDYFLRELADPQQRQVEAHVKTCPQCREELDRLRIAEAALFSVRDEEIPQRIAFVSDKVFEPSPWRRGWAAFWGSSARLGFASAAILATAIVFYALHPAPAPAPRVATVAAVAPVSDAQIQQRVQAALDQAIPEIEARYEKRTEALVKDVEQRDRAERTQLLKWADDTYDRMRTIQVAERRTAYNLGGVQ